LKASVFFGLLGLAGTLWADGKVYGGYFNDRLFNPIYNLVEGGEVSEIRAEILARGDSLLLIDALTPENLNKIDVFYTSKLSVDIPESTDEQLALLDFVKKGGVFLSTGECT